MMFGCGVAILQSMASLYNIFAVVRHWVPGSTNCHTIAMAKKENCNENKPRILSLMIAIIVSVNLKLIRNR